MSPLSNYFMNMTINDNVERDSSPPRYERELSAEDFQTPPRPTQPFNAPPKRKGATGSLGEAECKTDGVARTLF